MAITQPTYLTRTDDLVTHIGAYVDTAAVPVAVVDAKGDIIAATAANTVGRLAAGTNGYVLAADSTTGTGLIWVDASSLPVQVNNQTDSYTLAASDAGKVVEMNKATANNLTVPPNATVAFPIGTIVEVYQQGAGQTTVVAGAGVTVTPAAKLKLAEQGATATLRKRATNEWVIAGNVAA